MSDIEKVIGALSLLIVADTAITLLAVGYMGATELNPLCDLCGGLPAFLTLKTVVSVAGVIGLLWLGRTMPTAAKTATGVLCGLYGIVVLAGVAGLAGAVL